MGIRNLFRKNKEEITPETEEQFIQRLSEYITEAKKLGQTEEMIMSKFLDNKYPKELILKAFELNLQQEVKMAKEEEYEEDFEEEDSDEDSDEEDEDEPEVPKLKKKKKIKNSKEEPKVPTIQEVLMNHEQRIVNLEAKIFRMLNA